MPISRVRRMVLREALVIGGLGAAIGLGLAVWASRAARSLLFGISPADPSTFAAVAALLLAVAAAAGYLPARRASRIDTAVVIRGE